jgi:putative FmdB family regulatory protein
MPVYEYVCRDCDTVFEARRPMAAADELVACPEGHERVSRRLSVFATTGRAGPSAGESTATPTRAAPCGPACGCHH